MARRNAQGCSCQGGKSHLCQNIIREPVPRFEDIWSGGAINADSSNRKAVVDTWEKIGNNMSDYVSVQPDGLQNSSILCITELSPIKGAQLFFICLNQNNNNVRDHHVIEKLLPGENISVC